MKPSLSLLSLLPGLLVLSACGDDPAALLARARSEAAAGDNQAARIDLISALKASPADPVLLELLARVQLRLGDGDGALATVDRLARVVPTSPVLPRLRAEAELRRGNPDVALKLLGNDPDVDAWRIRAAAQRARGDDGAALNAFAAGSQAGGNKDLLVDYARFLSAGEDFAGAEAQLARARALAPDDFDVLMLTGDLCAREGRPRDALSAYQAAAARAPHRVEPLLGQAELADAAGKASDVAQLVAAAAGIAPDDPRVGRWKIEIAQSKGDWAAVRAALGPREASLDPASADGYSYAEALLHLGQPEQARALFSRALALSPQNPYARLMLAEAQLATGDGRSALATVRPLAEASDASERALELAERAARAAGLADAAAIAARRTSPEASENRRLAAEALAAFARGDWPSAAKDYAVLAQKGENAEVLRMQALSASRAGQHDVALAAADRALALKPDNPDMLYTAGLARTNARREIGRALELLQAALTADPRNMIYRLALARARALPQG